MNVDPNIWQGIIGEVFTIMNNVKFYKNSKKNFSSVMICNDLLNNDNELLTKMLEVVKLFSRKNMIIICKFFDYDKDIFAKEMEEKFSENINILFTRRKLFNKSLLSKMQITLSEESLNEVITSAIKNTASPEIEGRNSQGETLFEIGLNDNDGTFINFNNNEFCFDNIKEKINQIFA